MIPVEICLVYSTGLYYSYIISYIFINMTDQQANLLQRETLITLVDAAKDFGGLSIPISTVRSYIYNGVHGVKLESVFINRRYTSKEAITRFIEKRQNPQTHIKPKTERMTQAQVDAGLKRHGIVR